ncbi:MAG: radical SAM protein [Paraclostridium sp.]
MSEILEIGIDNLKYYEDYFMNLKKKNKFFSSLGTTFKTPSKFYLYDTGTGKIFDINENTYTVLTFLMENNDLKDIDSLQISLDEALDALKEIKEAIESEKILLAPTLNLENLRTVENLEKIYQNSINSVLLEVTEKCNLRCKYCIYNENYDGYREFGKIDMDFSIAEKAIDFLINHSKENDNLHIGFYGGEPLIKFDLIKKCIEYAKDKIDNSKLSFAITTNATLLTKEISDYITDLNKIYVTVSLDGPKDINDSYRVYPNSEGSFEDTIKGIENLVNSCESKGINPEEVLSINTVIDYPETQEKFNSIQKFFTENKLVSSPIQKTYSYASHGPEEIEYILPNSYEERESLKGLYENHSSITEWTIDLLKQKQNSTKLQNSDLFSYSDLNEMLVTVHSRAISNTVMDSYRLNSCCVPGKRRLYVEANGNLKPCERVGFSPALGNIKTGLDIPSIKKNYIDDFANEAIKYCNNCWAANICGVCYIDAYDENGVNMSYRHRHCESYRYNLKLAFSVYHEILETNPEALKFLNDIVYNF